MKNLPLAILLLAACAGAHAKPAYTGPNLSGIYSCKGDDAAEGPYTATVTLELQPVQSTGQNGAYRFKLEVPGFGIYPGYAATQGTRAAIYFANTDPSTQDFGTGIAQFQKNKAGKWTFSKFYYQPEYKGGNRGVETCIQQ